MSICQGLASVRQLWKQVRMKHICVKKPSESDTEVHTYIAIKILAGMLQQAPCVFASSSTPMVMAVVWQCDDTCCDALSACSLVHSHAPLCLSIFLPPVVIAFRIPTRARVQQIVERAYLLLTCFFRSVADYLFSSSPPLIFLTTLAGRQIFFSCSH